MTVLGKTAQHWRCTLKTWPLFLFVLSVVCWLPKTSAAQTPPDSVVAVAKAKLLELDTLGQAIEIELPHLELRSPRTFKRFKFTAEFTVADSQASALWAVYFLSLHDGGQIRINGVPAGNVKTSTETTTVQHVRPYLLQIPPKLLLDGVNRLEVVWASRETLMLISQILVAPAVLLMPEYQQRLFWQNDMAQVALVYALVIAAMLLGIFMLRRNQRSYLLLGLSAIGCAIVVFVYALPPMPYWLFPYWRFIHIAGIALFTQCAWVFLITQGQPGNRWFPKLCIFLGHARPDCLFAALLAVRRQFFSQLRGFLGNYFWCDGFVPGDNFGHVSAAAVFMAKGDFSAGNLDGNFCRRDGYPLSNLRKESVWQFWLQPSGRLICMAYCICFCVDR